MERRLRGGEWRQMSLESWAEGQISDVGLPMREFKQHPKSNTAMGGGVGGKSKDLKFRGLDYS